MKIFLKLISTFFLKAYVQQLESSRLKLTQLEQELQRARQQVVLYDFFREIFFPNSLVKFNYVFFQGIFISSTGDQAHSMGANGMSTAYYLTICLYSLNFSFTNCCFLLFKLLWASKSWLFIVLMYLLSRVSFHRECNSINLGLWRTKSFFI